MALPKNFRGLKQQTIPQLDSLDIALPNTNQICTMKHVSAYVWDGLENHKLIEERRKYKKKENGKKDTTGKCR